MTARLSPRSPAREQRSVAKFRTQKLVPAILLCISSWAAEAQKQTATREKLLEALEAGRLQEATALGEQEVARWPNDPEIHHYLGLAYFKSGALPQAREQLARARDLDPKDAATHFDL